MGYLSVLECELGVEDLELCILVLDGSVEVVQLALGVVLDLLHRGSVVPEVVIAFCF
jgi:hypothetical protein